MKGRGALCRALFAAGGILLLLLLTKNANIAANGIKKGMSVAGEVIIPSLFPFLVFSELLLALGFDSVFARVLGAPCRALFGLSPRGSVALALGWLLGVPIGAVVATKSLDEEKITRAEHHRLILITATPSIGFLVAMVGGSLFGERRLGWVLYGASLLASALLAMLLRILGGAVEEIAEKAPDGARKEGFSVIFTNAVRGGLSSLFTIIAFVLVFSMLGEFITVLVTALALPQALAVLVCGMAEMTAGMLRAVALPSPSLALLFSAFFAGFAGLSIAMQVLAVAKENAPRLSRFLIAKLFTGALATGAVLLFLSIFKPVLALPQGSLQTLLRLPAQLPHLGCYLFLFSLLYLFLHRVLSRPLVEFYKTK